MKASHSSGPERARKAVGPSPSEFPSLSSSFLAERRGSTPEGLLSQPVLIPPEGEKRSYGGIRSFLSCSSSHLRSHELSRARSGSKRFFMYVSCLSAQRDPEKDRPTCQKKVARSIKENRLKRRTSFLLLIYPIVYIVIEPYFKIRKYPLYS